MNTASSTATELQRSGNSAISRRWQATLIDFVFLYVFLIIGLGMMSPLSDQVKIGVSVLVISSYYLLLEGFTGFTVGKLLSGIRVVNSRGDKPSFLQGFVRTALRLLEVNPLILGGLPAVIAATMSSKGQRLGDMLAGTYVVCKEDLTPSD
jgi:uncharacterized RDD family membrane protein YckC